ncbi:MAG: CpXC domain-containing protein, partial [Thermoguttaceae bacterium]
MSLSSVITISCPACQHQQAFTAWQSINVTLDPALKEKLLDRSLVTFHCKQCGHTAGVNQGLLYHDMERRVMIMLGCQAPDDLELPERFAQEFQAEYSLRLVSSMTKLIEKVLLVDAGLDDRAIEIFKFAVMANIEESQRGDNPQLLFRGVCPDEVSQEQIEFALVNDAGTSSVLISLDQAY